MSGGDSTRRARTRARILAGAEPLFFAHGLRKVTVEDICAAARVSRRTFYQHFASRDELALEVNRTIVREISEPIMANFESRRPAAEIVSEHFRLISELTFSRLSTRFLAEAEAELPEVRLMRREYRRRIIDGLVKVIQRGQHEGSVQPGLNPKSIGKILNAILENSASPAFALANDLSVNEIIETLSALFMGGLLLLSGKPTTAPGRRRRKK